MVANKLVAIKGKRDGYPEMIKYFKDLGCNCESVKRVLSNQYYFIGEHGGLSSANFNSEKLNGYTLYESVEDVPLERVINKTKIYELW